MKKVVCINASNSELKNGNYYWVQDDEVDDAYYNILLPKGLEDGFWFKHRFKDVTEKQTIKKQKDSIVESVINQFKERSAVGIKKYGTTLDRNDLNFLEWVEHAKQEAMDFILYLEKLKQEWKQKDVSDATK